MYLSSMSFVNLINLSINGVSFNNNRYGGVNDLINSFSLLDNKVPYTVI